MRVFKHVLIVFLFIAILLGIPWGSSSAQTPQSIYVAETGHWIQEDFYRLYLSTPDPLILFGNPITEQIIDPTNGAVTQYFQKARFDQLEGPNGKTVQLAPLGELLYAEGSPLIPINTNTPSCRFFPRTGKSVCYAFLQFFDAHNGSTFFGNPISELEFQEGRYVQYFERSRMEWHPELQAGHRVVLTDLGRIYFDARVGDLSILEPANSLNNIFVPSKIHANAFAAQSLIPAGSAQTIYITIQDERYNPIQGAVAVVTLKFPDGRVETFRPRPTNSDGFTQFTFNVGNLNAPSIVQIHVDANYLDLEGNSESWFRIWW
jgi:hypothetical protein